MRVLQDRKTKDLISFSLKDECYYDRISQFRYDCVTRFNTKNEDT